MTKKNEQPTKKTLKKGGVNPKPKDPKPDFDPPSQNPKKTK